VGLASKLDKLQGIPPMELAGIAVARVRRKVFVHPAMRARMDRRFTKSYRDLALACAVRYKDEADLTEQILGMAWARHYLDDAQGTATLARQCFPEAVSASIAKADAICRHEFSFLGQDVRFGDTIEWAWRPEGNTPWPDRHADDYGHGFWAREDRPGDAKYPWELSRHQYFVTLGKAYQYTRDERYVRELIAQVRHWREANPMRRGIHWTSEMEFAIRIIAWTNALWLVRDSELFQREGLLPMLLGLYEHAAYLNATLTTHWVSRNNHIIGETAGLFTFAVLFPMFRESKRWRRRALNVLAKETGRQIYADGVNKEQSTSYHRFVVDFLLQVVRLARLNEVAVPEPVESRLEAMLDYERFIIPGDGLVPLIGDCDDGRGVLLSESVPFRDFRGWQAVGAVMFGRPDFARASDKGNEEALWFLGSNEREALKKHSPEPEAVPSRLFREGGHAVLRTGIGRGATSVLLRCGAFGLGEKGSSCHSHADMLAPVIHWRGVPLAVDMGTFAYYGSTARRDASRAATAHNTMTREGLDQGAMLPIWDWTEVPAARVTAWEQEEGRTHLDAECRSPLGFVHRRSLALTDVPLGLEIRDQMTLDDGEERVIEWRLHLAPDVSVLGAAEGAVTLRVGQGRNVVLRHEGFSACDVTPSQQYPAYGVSVPTQCVCLRVTGASVTTKVSIHDAD
jgi:uncharacterized heparinase superfamily protein